MRSVSRFLCLFLVLCLALPMCLISVNADEPVSYKIYHPDMDSWSYTSKGLIAVSKKIDQFSALYNPGKTNVMPYAYSSDASLYLNKADLSTFPLDGLVLQKAKLGDWVALKFRSPGEGYFSIDLEFFYYNAHMAYKMDSYLLPGNTASSLIGSKLTEANKLGSHTILEDRNNANQILPLSCTTDAELEANKDYLLVLKFTEDLYKPDEKRVDIMLTGLVFGKGYEKPQGSFDPVSNEVVVPDIIKTAEFYRAVSGVNPADGHDLMYLLFKGGTMMVYDMDARNMKFVDYTLHNTPFGQCFDPEGNLWLCGQGAFITKYNPATNELTKYNFAYSLFGGKKTNAYGILYGDDGYIYFTYWSWIGRLDPKTGDVINLSVDPLNTDPTKESDAQFSGHGGMVYKDGFLYLNIFGDLNSDKIQTSQLIKYDIANRRIVDFVDIAESTVDTNYGITGLVLLDNLLIGTCGSKHIPLYFDISGEKMVRLDSLDGIDSCFITGFSAPINGKVYAAGYVDNESTAKCIYEFDIATRTATRLGDIVFLSTLRAENGIATIVDDDNLPGISLVTPMNNTATGMVDLVFYNPTTMETVIWEGISLGYGSGMALRALEKDPTGRTLYTGAYGTNQIARYDIQTGKVVTVPSLNHQTDSFFWHDGFLWIGNYSIGSLLRLDPETDEVTSIMTLYETAFKQKRMFGLTAADHKVFVGSVPDTNRVGGVLAWYDIETDMTYVAAGPETKDVYYARTTDSFVVWRDVLTDTVQTFDDNGDNLPDYNIILDDKGDDDPTNDVFKQRFYGVIPNQCITHMCYKDGYIYGTTTRAGGQGANVDEYKQNAQLFVYDVNAMKVVSTCDVAQYISGLENPETGYIQFIDFLEEDPYEEGKFWGVICDTLFSCSFDFETMQFTNVKEELSMAKGKDYNGTDWFDREVIFDGDYMYLSFHNFGTFMVNTSDLSDTHRISSSVATEMSLAADGNLYNFSIKEATKFDLTVYRVGEYTQPLVAKSVQDLINALPDTVTMENEAQVMNVYKMYCNLLEITREKVDTQKLDAALAALADPQAAEADRLIDAIGEVTLQSEAAIKAARSYYDALPEATKAKVTKLAVLEAAEATLLELRIADADPSKPPVEDPGQTPDPGLENENNNTMTIVIIAAVAVVLIAGAVVALVLIRKKKSCTEE